MLAAYDDALGTRKGQVVTDKDSRTGNKSSWEGFVMTIPYPHDPRVIRDGPPGNGDAQDSEIARAVMSEAVR